MSFSENATPYITRICACVIRCVYICERGPGAHWLVCSGVRTVIKLSTCITRLNHHPAWLFIPLLTRAPQTTHTHTQIHLAISQDSQTQKHTACLLTHMTETRFERLTLILIFWSQSYRWLQYSITLFFLTHAKWSCSVTAWSFCFLVPG